MLEKLSNLPTERLPELIVVHNRHQHSTHASIDGSLSYLREILPLGAQFCEAHPTIGSKYHRLNAHGRPLNDHVVGICHSFPHHSIAELAMILDVFLPTRLAISPQNMVNTNKSVDWNDIHRDDDLEAVVNNTDMLSLEGANDQGFDTLAKHVWGAQEQDGAQNAFAICSTNEEAKLLESLFAEERTKCNW